MTSHNAAQRRTAGAFLIGSVIALASTLGLAAAPAQAQTGPGMIPVTGTWTRGGTDTVAWFDLGTWQLVTSIEGSRPVFEPQPVPWLPVAGDWDGDGVDTVQMFNPRDWSLVPAERGPVEGRVGDPIPWRPVAGDWDGDRIETVKVVNACDGTLHELEDGPSIVGFCDPDDWWFSVAGDWDGDGLDTLATYQPKGSSAIWASVFGDWDGDGIDTQATLHLPTNQMIEPEVEMRATSSPAVSSRESSSLSNLFAEDTECKLYIKNGKSVPTITAYIHGAPLYQCKNTWEEWTCCPSPILGYFCYVKYRSNIAPVCMF